MESNNTHNDIKQIKESIDRLANEISKLTLALDTINTSFKQTTTTTKSINETIVLYSISNDPLFNKLNLDDNHIVIRSCRSNIKNKQKLIKKHKNTTITIYREYIVSNPHNISYSIVNELKETTNWILKTHYGHMVINPATLDDVINSYDETVRTKDPDSISLVTEQYILNCFLEDAKKTKPSTTTADIKQESMSA